MVPGLKRISSNNIASLSGTITEIDGGFETLSSQNHAAQKLN
jgi:hypothetical protein